MGGMRKIGGGSYLAWATFTAPGWARAQVPHHFARGHFVLSAGMGPQAKLDALAPQSSQSIDAFFRLTAPGWAPAQPAHLRDQRDDATLSSVSACHLFGCAAHHRRRFSSGRPWWRGMDVVLIERRCFRARKPAFPWMCCCAHPQSSHGPYLRPCPRPRIDAPRGTSPKIPTGSKSPSSESLAGTETCWQ